MKKKLLFIVLFMLGIIGVFIIIKMISFQKSWKVEINEDYINLREDHNTSSLQINKVYKGKKYKVKDIYLDDQLYVWYKIEYKPNKTGWIASLREEPFVKEINNPNQENSNKAVFIDYSAPKIQFYNDVYSVYDINSIKYNHLEITDDSEYEIEHKVYCEKKSNDSDVSQYWIKYIVTDSFGNESSKIQKIEFTEEPKEEQVLSWESQ